MVDTIKQRKPDFKSVKPAPSGQVTRDERGNAVWDWAGEREEINGNVEHLGLAIEGTTAPPDARTAKGQPAKAVFEPYLRDSAGKAQGGKRRDLRALSRHIEQQRQRAKDQER
jgi:hypothetical protein